MKIGNALVIFAQACPSPLVLCLSLINVVCFRRHKKSYTRQLWEVEAWRFRSISDRLSYPMMDDLLSIKMSLPESHTQHLQHLAAASSVCHYALQGKTYLPLKCYLLHFPDCNSVPPIKKSNVEKTHSSCLTETTALFFTPASLLIFLPELTGPILRHISVCIRHLQEYMPRAETNDKQKLGLCVTALGNNPSSVNLVHIL